MADPIKISEQNRALSCDEYDKNLDILQDRANHVGTQSCDTLNDLEDCLGNSDTVNNLQMSITDNQNRIVGLEDAVQAGGSIATSVANLETRLKIDINNNRDANEATQIQLDEVDLRTASNAAGIAAQKNYIDQQDGNLQTQITSAVQTNTNQETILTNHTSQINGLNTRLLTESGERSTRDTNLQSQINTEVSNRTAGDNNITAALGQEVSTLNAKINTNKNDLTSAIVDLAGHLNSETQQRQDKDNDLQLQINTLNASLSGAVPTGTILAYAGTTAPPGYLICEGQNISRNTYAALFSILSTRYGSINSTTFKIPDLRSKVLYGSHNTNLNSVDPYYGENEVNILASQLPKHKHAFVVPKHRHTYNVNHVHGLNIRPHTHSIGGLPNHVHSLFPYRGYSEGNGDRGGGAELTSVENDDGPNIHPNTSGIQGAIPGPTVGTTTTKIYPTNADPNIQKTDSAFTEDRQTDFNADYISSTGETGGTTTLDLRQASGRVNFIIKT